MVFVTVVVPPWPSSTVNVQVSLLALVAMFATVMLFVPSVIFPDILTFEAITSVAYTWDHLELVAPRSLFVMLPSGTRLAVPVAPPVAFQVRVPL